MSKCFDTSRRDRLHSESRFRLLPPERTLLDLGLAPGDRVVDIGCGTGFFTLPAARIAGATGRVTGIDPSPDMRRDLEQRAAAAGATVTVLAGRAEELPLPDGGMDFSLMVNVLHEVDRPRRALAEALRVLAPGGRMAVVEWSPDYPGGGPPVPHRLSPEKIRRLLEAAGFVQCRAMPAGAAHWGVTARRPDSIEK